MNKTQPALFLVLLISLLSVPELISAQVETVKLRVDGLI